MKNLFVKLKVLGELVLTFSGIYAAIVFTFSSVLVNVLLIIVSLFILSQALGNIDELNGYNQKKSTGFPDNKHTRFPGNHHHSPRNYPPGFPDDNGYDYPDYDTGNPDVDLDDDTSDTDDLNDNDYPEIPE